MTDNVKGKKTDMHGQGTLFVISAPSGAGKTTLCKRLLKKDPRLRLSVSYTTREPRRGEVNDVHYTFITDRQFRNMIHKGEFAEWASVHGNLYGTSIKRLKKLNKEGYDIILDIDTHGAMQIKKTYDNAVYVFVLPPSLEALKERLLHRGTDSEETIQKRMDNARAEISQVPGYDYIIVNDRIDQAFKDLESVVRATRLKTVNADRKWIKKFIK